MRVFFLVQNEFLRDKQEPVYDVFAADPDVETIIVLAPSYTAMSLKRSVRRISC